MWAVWWRCDGAVSQVIIRPALSSRNQDNYILNIVTQQTFFISTVDTVDTQTISTSFCILYTANRQFKPPLNYWISLPKTIPRLALRLGPERHDCAKQRAKQRAKRWWRWWHLTTLTMASPHLHDVIRHVCDVWRTIFGTESFNQTALLHTVLRTSDLFQYLINCGLHFDHSQHLPHVCIWCTHVYYDVDFRMDRNIKIMKCWLLIKSTGFQKHIVQPRPGCADSINKELIHKIFETRHNNGGDMFKTLHQSEEEEEGGKKWCANQQGYWMSSW